MGAVMQIRGSSCAACTLLFARLPTCLCAARDSPRPPPPQGLPVFYARGEAEATAAALAAAGCVDGCVSTDSDCLLYGAEVVYPALKLSVRASACRLPPGTGGTSLRLLRRLA